MGDLLDVTRRLAEVQDRLLALPGDAHAERYELLMERDRLRADAGRYASQFEEQRSTPDLLAELRAIESALAADFADRGGLMAIPAPGGSGGHPAAVTGEMLELALKAKSAGGLDVLRSRHALIVQILEARGVEPSPAPATGAEPVSEP